MLTCHAPRVSLLCMHGFVGLRRVSNSIRTALMDPAKLVQHQLDVSAPSCYREDVGTVHVASLNKLNTIPPGNAVVQPLVSRISSSEAMRREVPTPKVRNAYCIRHHCHSSAYSDEFVRRATLAKLAVPLLPCAGVFHVAAAPFRMLGVVQSYHSSARRSTRHVKEAPACDNTSHLATHWQLKYSDGEIGANLPANLAGVAAA